MRIVVHVESKAADPYNGQGARFVATCRTGDCTWVSKPQAVKVAAEDEARWHREQHRQGAVQ